MKKSFETSVGEKQRCRDLLCSRSKEVLGTSIKKILTLPSREALCYHTFNKAFKRAKIVCIERDLDICEDLWKQDIDCINTTIQDYAQEKTRVEQHHDVLFLDYYSFMSKSILEDLKALIKNRNILHKGKRAVIGITLMKGMRQNKDETLKIMQNYIYKGERLVMSNTVDSVGEALCNFLGCEFELDEVTDLDRIEYRAQDNSTPMYFYTIAIKV